MIKPFVASRKLWHLLNNNIHTRTIFIFLAASGVVGAILTMYIYKKSTDINGVLSLKPHLKYEYSYAEDGTLISRVAYRWTDSQNLWVCTGRHDYTLFADTYYATYSRYNSTNNSFDQPMDQMVYILNPMHQDNNPLS